MRKREICTCVNDPQTLSFHVLVVLVGNDEATRDRHFPKHSSCTLLVLHCAGSFASFGFSLVPVGSNDFIGRSFKGYLHLTTSVSTMHGLTSRCLIVRPILLPFITLLLNFCRSVFFSLKEKGLKEPCKRFSGANITSRCFLRLWRVDRFDPSIRFEDRIFDQMPSIEKVFATIDVNSFGCR